MPNPQSWAFMELEEVWAWKTPTGFMSFDDEGESFLVIFPSRESAEATAHAAQSEGEAVPYPIRHIWLAASAMEGEADGYAWIDGESVELYRIADMPSVALELMGVRDA